MTQVTKALKDIWEADEAHIPSYSENRFPTSFAGNFVVKVRDPTMVRANPADHRMLELFKWDNDAYHLIDNLELLRHAEYKSYKLVYTLLDNFESDDTKPEVNTQTESVEVRDFLNYVVDSKPMEIATSYLNVTYGTSDPILQGMKFDNRDNCLQAVKQVWFEQYDWNSMQSLSGFEHTFVGERKASRRQVSGYHFWYKYFVDDSRNNAYGKDAIDFIHNFGSTSDDYISIGFKQSFDVDGDGELGGDGDASHPKTRSSFFVGISAECKMALGLICFFEGERRVRINGHQYKLTLHKGGSSGEHMRSFYPVL